MARVRELTAGFRDRAAAAEAARTLPRESVDALLGAGITRILIPPRFGGYGLGLDTWFEVVREIAKADASHGWCASLMIHHPHYLSQFSEAGAESGLGGGHRCRDRGFDPAVRPGDGGGRRISDFRRISVRQRHQSQPLAHRRQHRRGIRRRARRNFFSSGRGNSRSRIPGSPAPCARPAATPRCATTFTSRKVTLWRCPTSAKAGRRAANSTPIRSTARRGSAMRR